MGREYVAMCKPRRGALCCVRLRDWSGPKGTAQTMLKKRVVRTDLGKVGKEKNYLFSTCNADDEEQEPFCSFFLKVSCHVFSLFL